MTDLMTWILAIVTTALLAMLALSAGAGIIALAVYLGSVGFGVGAIIAITLTTVMAFAVTVCVVKRGLE